MTDFEIWITFFSGSAVFCLFMTLLRLDDIKRENAYHSSFVRRYLTDIKNKLAEGSDK